MTPEDQQNDLMPDLSDDDALSRLMDGLNDNSEPFYLLNIDNGDLIDLGNVWEVGLGRLMIHFPILV